MAVVEVTPSDLPPVRYKGQIWIRTGPRKAAASEHEERILSERRIASARTFDAHPCREASIKERTFSPYPEQAVRELLMNAIMHRSYESNTPVRFYWFSDHIEIMSPGGLYGEATKANFPTRNSYRNPVIAEAMKELGYVNRYGYGVQRAQALLRDNGNPPRRLPV